MENRIIWPYVIFFILSPIFALGLLIAHFYYESTSLGIWLYAAGAYSLSILTITAGYHRLYAHRSYEANSILKFFLLFFGSACLQNSALNWSTDHRRHHGKVDTDNDPYNIKQGFWYAHILWIFKEGQARVYPKDLLNDRLVMFQHNHYFLTAIVSNFLIGLIAYWMFGNLIGAIAIPVIGRIVCVHHATFFINSLAHMFGSRPYDQTQTARDNHFLAILTFGEGYHNFHHSFQADYRNGVRWYHFDPGKWFIRFASYFKLASGLKKTPEHRILAKRINGDFESIPAKLESSAREKLDSLREKLLNASKQFELVKSEYSKKRSELGTRKEEKLLEFKKNMKMAKLELQYTYKEWKLSLKKLAV